jgi:hypothetical protein
MAPYMFKGGLSKTLITTLEVICKIVEDLDKDMKSQSEQTKSEGATKKKAEKGGEMARGVIQSLLFK